MSRPLGFISFDIDDTLYPTADFFKLARENSVRAMLAMGFDVPEEAACRELEELIQEFTSNDRHLFDRLVQRFPPACSAGINPLILVAAAVTAYHNTKQQALRPHPDVLNTLASLKAQGYRMGAISQGFGIKQAEKLVRLNVLPYLDKSAIFLSDQVGISKSNPKFFLRAAEAVGVAPDRCMHVGDHPVRDIEPAKAAGWHTVLCKFSGRHHLQPCAARPDFVVESFLALEAVLEQHFRPA
jgi:putative hydrolase of the HAD superfamily